MKVSMDDRGDTVCEHGTAVDVHCCNCHSGFLFDIDWCVCVSEDKMSETAAEAFRRDSILARALAKERGMEIAKLQTRIYRQRLANKKARGLNASIPLHKKRGDEAIRQMAIYKDQNEKLLKTVESLRSEILELRASRAEDLAGQDN